MEKITCGIIQDLLTSYCDNLTTESVRQLIQKHLSTCPQCQQRYMEIQKQQELAEKEELARGKHFGKKLKKTWIGILVGSFLSIITLGGLFIIFVLFFIFGGPPEITTDIAKYQDTITSYENMHTALITFPEQIPESAEDTEFYFWYQDTFNFPTLEVYLQCTYNEEDYQAEILRLENTQKRYGSTVRTLIQDERETYPYPAYIAIDGAGHSYEYALLSGDQQITYVFTLFKSGSTLEKIDKKYLPSDFDARMEHLGFGEGYNIYLSHMDVVNGEIQMIEHDYTRDPLTNTVP